MSLSVGLDIARRSLSTSAEQTAVVSRNVARAGDPSASRKIVNLTTALGGGAQVASISRVTNAALYESMLTAASDAGSKAAVADALDWLESTVNDPELESSPSALIGKLADAIQQYASAPNDIVRAKAAVQAANRVAQSLQEATAIVQDVRRTADAQIGTAVTRINDNLAKFETLNKQIIAGTRSGADVTDQLDQRDQLVAQLAEDIGIQTVQRPFGDLAIFTDSGVPLFEGRARVVSFKPNLSLGAHETGAAVLVDGVPITGGGIGMPIASGALKGLTEVRDKITVTYQGQLDEIARSLIATFAETDQNLVPSLPNVPGLFTYPGAPAIPADGVVSVGLAGQITVNPALNPDQGGDATLLRDGGAAGADYDSNPANAAGFSARLQGLIDKLSSAQAFDPMAEIGSSTTIGKFASTSISWLQQLRQTATTEAEYRTTLFDRTREALSKETGVNLDEEMARLLELERSYQASSKLVSIMNEMFGTLMAALR